jgi:hypothetical protein
MSWSRYYTNASAIEIPSDSSRRARDIHHRYLIAAPRPCFGLFFFFFLPFSV